MSAAWNAAEEAHRRYAEEAARRPAGSVEQLSPRYFFDDPRYQMAKASFVDLRAVCSGLALGALVFGIHSGGGDWSSRVVLTLASAEPRRLRLFAVRGALTAAVAAVVTLLTALLLVPLLLAVARHRGTLAGTDAHYWQVLAVIVVRAAAFVGAVALLGHALGMLTRSLVPALGCALAYLVAAERLVQDYAPSLTEFHLSGIAFAVLNEQLLMSRDKTDCVGEIACLTMREGTTATEAFLGLACYVVPVVALAATRFVRRDIT
ncbi:hypothetical protein [Streptomyces sp. NPDC002187]|uniref:hypothetical protein n=1 Tax=Streptomyces sp. NPDC002187 TaxID=3364637 RepID=UPI0036ABAE64